MKRKRCSKCGLEKPINSFCHNKSHLGGLHHWCKVCSNEATKSWNRANKKNNFVGGELARSMKVCSKCKIEKSTGAFAHDKSTKDGFKFWCKDCCKEHRRGHPEHDKIYKNKHKNELLVYGKIYAKNRRFNDINFKIICSLRSRLNCALRNKQKFGSAVRDLGCSIEQLKLHLEKHFQPGMSWSNYGRYDPNQRTWVIDHIKPVKAFTDLTKREQVLKLCNYKNLQPLWWDENSKKGSFYKMCGV